MTLRKYKIIGIFTFVVILSLVFFQKHVFASMIVGLSDYSEISPNLFVDNQLSLELRNSIAATVKEARKRVSEKYGTSISDPVFIASSTRERSSRFFAGRVTPGALNHTPWGQYIPLSPDGINVDVIAHEFLHAEIFLRLGYVKFLQMSLPEPLQSIPIWFNEGVGMQVDHRENKAWAIIQDGKELPHVSTLKSVQEFFSGDIALHYAASKVEVSSWLASNSELDLYAFINKVSSGAQFHQLYQSEDKRVR